MGLTWMTALPVVCGYGVCLAMGILCAILLIKIWNNEIDLRTLLNEANGDASMSRFQLLVFTMVVAISIFLLVEEKGYFPYISDGVLTLLGISASTYAVGKGISYSRTEGVTTPEERTAERAAERAAVGRMSATGASAVATPAGAAATGATDPNKPVA